MDSLIRLVPPNSAVEILGIRLVGVTADNGKKVLFTLAFIAIVYLLGRLAKYIARLALQGRRNERFAFWMRQGIGLTAAAILVLGVASIWFDDPMRLTTALGLVSAGLAFALQKVVTALAGYFVILRGKTFNVGDRIVMGGVRGDVMALGFTQTTIMEMGQPPTVQKDDPAMWVSARQYTGRIVTVSNAKIFDEPVYNYSRDFPYIWEEIRLPIPYDADYAQVETILKEAAERHTVDATKLSENALREMERRYFLASTEVAPKIYCRITDNWLEMTVRFIVEDRGVRGVKDAMSREIIAKLAKAGIRLASSSVEIVGLPQLLQASRP